MFICTLSDRFNRYTCGYAFGIHADSGRVGSNSHYQMAGSSHEAKLEAVTHFAASRAFNVKLSDAPIAYGFCYLFIARFSMISYSRVA